MNSLVTIFVYAICFGNFFLLTWHCKINRSNRLFDTEYGSVKNPGSLLGLYIGGMVWLALIPFLLCTHSINRSILYGIAPTASFIITLIFLLTGMVVTGTLSTHNIPFDHKQDTLLTKNFLHWFIVLRILFLCGYELFFRGFLLFDCIQWLGIPWAITISTGLTVLIHVFNGKKEMWACIPFGIILCSCCIAVHAVWPAIILHIALAMSHELTLIAQFLTKLKPAK